MARDGVDLYALTHNETSTGVAMEVRRPAGASGLVAVDATSAPAACASMPPSSTATTSRPQKCFAADGGLWVAAARPPRSSAIERLRASGRWVPAFLDLGIALENSRLDQTYNTPALATLFLFAEQLGWMLNNGGLEWAASRCDRSAEILYGWAERSDYATPFVADPASAATSSAPSTSTAASTPTVSAVLRANGMVDTESYRKLGRNQLRIAMFPGIDPDDVAALTACVDHVAAAL